MSFSPPFQTSFSAPSDCAVPYETYAELVRMLLPGVRRICFYDQACCVQWISDGLAEQDLSMQVQKVLLQADGSLRQSCTMDSANAVVHVSVVRGLDDSVQGAIAVVLARRKYRRRSARAWQDDIETALAPVLRILGHALAKPNATRASCSAPAPVTSSPVRQAPFVGVAARATSAPVLLRRMLSNAVNASTCAFGTLIAAERQFTLLQRGIEHRAQDDMRSVADALRKPLAELMHRRNEPLVVTSSEHASFRSLEYKFVAHPLRRADGRLVALLALFRRPHERDFDFAECASLQHIATRTASHVLNELAPLAGERTQAHFATESLDPIATPPESAAEPSMEQRLRSALREDRFALHAQSIVPIRQAANIGRHEVLLRMQERNSLALPHDFFDVAEHAGLLPDLDRWVVTRLIKAVLPHLEALQAGRLEFSLNVSAASLRRDSFGDFIETQLFRSAVPPQTLVFEFSEYDVLAHRPEFERLAPRLADLGCRIALDNCKQGLDIFLSIADLPVHRLKVDAALTHHLVTDMRAARSVRELIEVASDIGIETVGEQIEDEATRVVLGQLGFDFAQGFTVGRPQPLAALLN